MLSGQDPGLLLGKQVDGKREYAPELLFPIPRAQGRSQLAGFDATAVFGVDLWHAYELSWLEDDGRPCVWLGKFSVPADSPNIIESKSFKLYLNALNSHRFASRDEAVAVITRDLTLTAGAPVTLALFAVDDAHCGGGQIAGTCIDRASLPEDYCPTSPAAASLATGPGFSDAAASGWIAGQQPGSVSETLYSHLLRSLCPVTGQPDWATLVIQYTGPAIDHSTLLAYVLGYREHQEFHEQCVERIFCDLREYCAPTQLTVQALYTRRGGLDINPLRSTEQEAQSWRRLVRQ